MHIRAGLLACTTMAVLSASAAAQTRVVVEGRVVEQGSSNAIAGASVDLDGHPVIATSAAGNFRFTMVTPGAYALRVSALGYATRDLFLVVRRDTTVVIEMAVAPVPLDTVAVRGRRIDLRGSVTEPGSDVGLLRADVVTNLDRGTRTNSAGRFRLRDVPAAVPIVVGIRAFGYLPRDSTIIAANDTTIVFELVVDSLVQRMIAVEVARLEQRSRPYRAAIMQAIDRELLLRRANGTALDVIRSEYGPFLARVRCILIDDVQTYNGLAQLNLFLPDELERIEVLERGAMLRIYTRDFIRRMLGGGVTLQRPVYLEYGRPPLCR